MHAAQRYCCNRTKPKLLCGNMLAGTVWRLIVRAKVAHCKSILLVSSHDAHLRVCFVICQFSSWNIESTSSAGATVLFMSRRR